MISACPIVVKGISAMNARAVDWLGFANSQLISQSIATQQHLPQDPLYF
jgi:hypothetical protein